MCQLANVKHRCEVQSKFNNATEVHEIFDTKTHVTIWLTVIY